MMNPLKIVFPLVLSMVFAIVVPGSPITAQTASPKDDQQAAPGLRKLTGDDAKRAEELDKSIESALTADHWDEAITKAKELFALRKRVQGPKHFEMVDAKY